MSREPPSFAGASCPLPLRDYPKIQMAHGGGGRLTQSLIDHLFLPAFDHAALWARHDGAVLPLGDCRVAFTTDSYVVRPLFFPGGDIGALAVHGTVNDLAMCGARPLALSAGFIIEEGFAMEELARITNSMARAARGCHVPVVTGDTKVVDRGKGDGVYVNTAGLGVIADGVECQPAGARPGDRIILSGEIAAHGIAVLSVREGIEFDTTVESDSAGLWNLVEPILERHAADVHVLRDPTRGGVASALNEIATAAGVGMVLDEALIPVCEQVRGACELLGLDPLYVANEGKCLAIVTPDAADAIAGLIRQHPLGSRAAIVGEVVADHPGTVCLRSTIGSLRILDLLSGEQLPRIC